MAKRLLMLLLCVFVVALSADERKLIVVGEDWPPVEFVKDGNVVGMDVDIAKIIFDKLNIPVEFKIYPWKRAWKMVEEGQADAVFSLSRKEKREPFVYYPTEDMWVSEYVFFVKTENKKANFSSYDDAKGLKVGIIAGNSYHDSFFGANLTTEEAPDLETNIKKLAAGRVDLVICDKTTGLYTAKLLGLQSKVTPYDFIAFSKGYPVAFTKKSTYPNIKEIGDKFEAELKKMKESGEYQKIVDKWLK